MKLTHPLFEESIAFEENKINVLIIEDSKTYGAFLAELLEQNRGAEGKFVLTEKLKVQNLEKAVDIVVDPFSLDFCQKKIITRLYNRLKENVMSDELYMETSALFTEIVKYIEKVIETIDYPLEYLAEPDISGVFKLLDLKPEANHENLLEKLIDYMRIVQEFCEISTFIFVNLKCYFSDEWLEALHEQAAYQKWNILLLENTVRTKSFDWEQRKIIDVDLCEIF